MVWTFLLQVFSVSWLTLSTAMTSYKSPAKKIRSVNRLINFIKKKCLEEKHQNLSITVLPSTSLTPNLSPKPNQNLAISKTTMIDVPPDISLSIYVCSPHLSSGENLPQLDGCTPDIPSSFQCPDCRTKPKMNWNTMMKHTNSDAMTATCVSLQTD